MGPGAFRPPPTSRLHLHRAQMLCALLAFISTLGFTANPSTGNVDLTDSEICRGDCPSASRGSRLCECSCQRAAPLKADDHPKKSQIEPLLGSYPHIIQNSATNLSSDADVAATVAAVKASGQSMIGMYIDECYWWSLLQPLLEATRGTAVAVFGMLRSHNGPIYCQAVYGNSTWNTSDAPASGQEVNWTHVAIKLAQLSNEFPHFIGYTIDDFYCMMQDPNSPPDPVGWPPRLSVAAMADAHSAMKAVAPHFKFMPTVYPGYLGVLAGTSGLTLGVGAGRPFDTNTSASVTFTLPLSTSAADGGAVAFMLASDFASWDRKGFANPVWAGKIFIRAMLELANGSNVVLADVDLYNLVGCNGADAGGDEITHCIPQEMMRVTGSATGVGAWTSLVIELYARDQVNLNYYNNKVCQIWNVSIEIDGTHQPISSFSRSFDKHPSKAAFNNRTNVGFVQAHDNADFTIRGTSDGVAACDGLLFPFAENGGLVYTSSNYDMLLQLALDATRGHGQAFWALHYGWMWPGAFGDAHEVDSAALARMIAKDRRAQVDAVVIWGLRMEVGNIGTQQGIFTERRASQSSLEAAKAAGYHGGVAQAWFPGYTPGYGGFHQSWTSRSPLRGNLSIGINRAFGSSFVTTGPDDGPWYFSATVRVVNGPLLYNASAGVVACTKGYRSSGPAPCPGMDSDVAAALGITCILSCVSTQSLGDSFDVASNFPEAISLHIPSGGHLSGNANGDVHLTLELSEHKGVGNFASGVQFALPSTEVLSQVDKVSHDTVPGWAYASGLRDASLVSNYWAVVGAFSANA
eukprot:SAG31_NODE_1109_length_9860_cov_22.119353_1_plen_805_part_00